MNRLEILNLSTILFLAKYYVDFLKITIYCINVCKGIVLENGEQITRKVDTMQFWDELNYIKPYKNY